MLLKWSKKIKNGKGKTDVGKVFLDKLIEKTFLLFVYITIINNNTLGRLLNVLRITTTEASLDILALSKI